MSTEPDVGRIHSLQNPPPDTPDQKTQEEEREVRKKPISPTERAEVYHKEHLASLVAQIDHHKGECELRREEITIIRASLEKAVEKAHVSENTLGRVRESAWMATATTVLGAIILAIGSAMFGFAGCWPDLADWAKHTLAGGGLAASACGIALTGLSYYAGKRSQS